MADFTF